MELKIGKNILCDGITGVLDSKEEFISLFNEENFAKEVISLDSKRLTNQEKENLYSEITIIKEDMIGYSNMTVYEYLKKLVIEKELNLKNYRKKIIDSMKIIGFQEAYLKRSISELSTFELKMITFAGELLKNPKIIVFNNFFNNLDIKNTKVLIRLINQMVDKFNKMIIICSNDINLLYNYSENMIIYSDLEILIQGKTDYIFEKKIELLQKKNISIPYSVKLVIKAREKGINLNYNKDIRDLIKDIYKKV